MIIINSVSNTRFSFNGIEYFRNYISVVRDDRVEIFNCYEREDVMLSLTHYSEVTLNGITYSNATDLQSALQLVIYSRATLGSDEIEVIEQNNIGKVIQLNYVTGNNLLNQVLTNINSTTTVVSATDNPVFFTAYKSASTSVVAQKLRFQFMGGKGTWGAGGKTVLPSHLYQLAPEALLPDDITANSKSNVVSLGQISSSNDFINKANSTTRNFSDTSKLHFLSYTLDSVLYLKRFTGQPGEYDDTTTVLTEDDFEDATNSNVQPGLFTPSLKDITNIDPSTDVPITIVDNNSGNKTTFTGNQIKHASLDGNTTTIDYEQNTDDVSYTIPAKNTDDVFAMQSDINGMTITANQSASELYLKNAEGTVLATINVGFLNNEGTTFFFNETTEKLELKNDQGSVLSSVPVSAFVSNLIQSVNFNGSIPYVLEFKDAENNIVDSVSFSISNIQGLQAALDGKMSTSHPANALTSENISNWNTTYGWGNHSGLYLPLGADIPDAADLNTYIQTGIYIQRFNFQAVAGTNYPVPLKGFLEVLKSPDGLISQKYHVGGGDSNTYYIRVFGNTWTGWKKVLDSVDITNSDIANWNTAYGSLGSFFSYTGANQTIDTNNQIFTFQGGWLLKTRDNFEVKRLFDTSDPAHFFKLTDVAAMSRPNDPTTIGDIVITLPIRTTTEWLAEIDIIQGSGSIAKIALSGYSRSNTGRKITLFSGFGWITDVKYGRNSNNDTVLIIKRSTGTSTFANGKVNINTFYHSLTYNVDLEVKSNYKVEFIDESTLIDFTLTATINQTEFERDPMYALATNTVNRTTDQYAVNAIQGKKEWIGKQLITTRTIQKFGQNDNNFIRRLEFPSIYNAQSGAVNGNIRIELPLTTSTMWSMKVTVIEYRSASPSNLLSPAEFIITGYGNNTVANKSVWCSNPDRFTQVRFGRNTADNATVIYIDKAESFQYPKVIIEYIDFHYTNSSIYDDAAFPITITTDNSNFVSNGTITNTDFVRDSFYFNYLVSNSYLRPGSTMGYGSSGESLNDMPIGTYTAVLSTNTTNKPFNNLGGLISVGAANGQGTQILGSRSGNELWFRPFSNTYGAWYRLWNSGDFSAADVANWNAAYNRGDFRDYGLGSSSNLLFPGNDLNNITVPNGFYAVANNFTNTPISSSGSLMVERYAGYITQKYQAINAGDVVRMFIRHYKTAAESWTPWREIWTSENLNVANIVNWNNAYSWGNHSGLYVKMLGNTLSNGTGDVVTINSLGNIKYRTAVEVRQDAGIADADITDWHRAYNHSQATGNPHNTQITDISGLQSTLSGKANAINTLSYKGVIPNSSDLNNYTQTGFYITHDAESNSNTPSDNNGLLHVSFDSGITACQTYHDSNNDLYVRTINEAGNWLPWDRTTKASERIINEDLATSPTQVILNSLYPNARATFTVIAPNVEKGYMYVKTNDGWLEFIGSPVY